MSRQMGYRTVWPPKSDGEQWINMWISIKGEVCAMRSDSLTSLAELMSTAQACRSHLLPTSTIGTSSASLTRFICSRYVPARKQNFSFKTHFQKLQKKWVSKKKTYFPKRILSGKNYAREIKNYAQVWECFKILCKCKQIQIFALVESRTRIDRRRDHRNRLIE